MAPLQHVSTHLYIESQRREPPPQPKKLSTATYGIHPGNWRCSEEAPRREGRARVPELAGPSQTRFGRVVGPQLPRDQQRTTHQPYVGGGGTGSWEFTGLSGLDAIIDPRNPEAQGLTKALAPELAKAHPPPAPG
jgi:hypothetical protein